jgi:hypothetical protein
MEGRKEGRKFGNGLCKGCNGWKKGEGRKRREKQKMNKILLFLLKKSQSILKSFSFLSFFLRVVRVFAVR